MKSESEEKIVQKNMLENHLKRKYKELKKKNTFLLTFLKQTGSQRKINGEQKKILKEILNNED